MNVYPFSPVFPATVGELPNMFCSPEEPTNLQSVQTQETAIQNTSCSSSSFSFQMQSHQSFHDFIPYGDTTGGGLMSAFSSSSWPSFSSVSSTTSLYPSYLFHSESAFCTSSPMPTYPLAMCQGEFDSPSPVMSPLNMPPPLASPYYQGQGFQVNSEQFSATTPAIVQTFWQASATLEAENRPLACSWVPPPRNSAVLSASANILSEYNVSYQAQCHASNFKFPSHFESEAATAVSQPLNLSCHDSGFDEKHEPLDLSVKSRKCSNISDSVPGNGPGTGARFSGYGQDLSADSAIETGLIDSGSSRCWPTLDADMIIDTNTWVHVTETDRNAAAECTEGQGKKTKSCTGSTVYHRPENPNLKKHTKETKISKSMRSTVRVKTALGDEENTFTNKSKQDIDQEAVSSLCQKHIEIADSTSFIDTRVMLKREKVHRGRKLDVPWNEENVPKSCAADVHIISPKNSQNLIFKVTRICHTCDCDFRATPFMICPLCSPHHLLESKSEGISSGTPPTGINVFNRCTSTHSEKGLLATSKLEPKTVFGPLKGVIVGIDSINRETPIGHLWSLKPKEKDGEVLFLDTSDEEKENWLTRIRVSRQQREHNTAILLKDGQILFVTTQKVYTGQELLLKPHNPVTIHLNRAYDVTCLKCDVTLDNPLQVAQHRMIFHLPPLSVPPVGLAKDEDRKPHGALNDSPFGASIPPISYRTASSRWRCKICPAFFKSYSGLRAHRSIVHNQGTSGNQQAAYTCAKCDGTFKTQWGLDRHLRTHALEEMGHTPMDCSICGKRFWRRSSFRRHMLAHNSPGEFHKSACCSCCGRSFYSSSNLKVHMLTHSGIRPFMCNQENCSSGFTTKQSLQFHYIKRHFFSYENMPEISRSVPFTFEEYAGIRNAESTAGSKESFGLPGHSGEEVGIPAGQDGPSYSEADQNGPSYSGTAEDGSLYCATAQDRPLYSGTAQDGPLYSSTTQDGPSYSGTAEDGPLYSGTAQDGPLYSDTAEDGPSYSGTAKDGPSYSGTAEDGPSYSGTAEDGPLYSGTAQDGPSYSGTAQDEPSRSSSGTAQNVPLYSGTAHDEPSSSGTAQNVPLYSGTAQDGPSYSGTAQDGPSCSGTAQDGPLYSGTAQDGPLYSGTAQDEHSRSSSGTAQNVPLYSGTAQDEPSSSGTAQNVPLYSSTAQDGPSSSGTAQNVPLYSSTAQDEPSYSDTAQNVPLYSSTAQDGPLYNTAQDRPFYNNTAQDRPTYSEAGQDGPSYTESGEDRMPQLFSVDMGDRSS